MNYSRALDKPTKRYSLCRCWFCCCCFAWCLISWRTECSSGGPDVHRLLDSQIERSKKTARWVCTRVKIIEQFECNTPVLTCPHRLSTLCVGLLSKSCEANRRKWRVFWFNGVYLRHTSCIYRNARINAISATAMTRGRNIRNFHAKLLNARLFNLFYVYPENPCRPITTRMINLLYHLVPRTRVFCFVLTALKWIRFFNVL